jgi:hypothetical protein
MFMDGYGLELYRNFLVRLFVSPLPNLHNLLCLPRRKHVLCFAANCQSVTSKASPKQPQHSKLTEWGALTDRNGTVQREQSSLVSNIHICFMQTSVRTCTQLLLNLIPAVRHR